MTPTPTAPARHTSLDAHRAGHLRRLGYTVTAGDGPGVWLAKRGVCQWFASPAAAVRAVEAGWPNLPETIK